MPTGIPTPTDFGPAVVGDALAALRAASGRVAELAPSRQDSGNDTDDHAFDAGDHAAHFEELHEALSAVLDELDRA